MSSPSGVRGRAPAENGITVTYLCRSILLTADDGKFFTFSPKKYPHKLLVIRGQGFVVRGQGQQH